MESQVVPVKNIKLFVDRVEELHERPSGVPGFGLMWGATGAGKTTACAWFASDNRAIYQRASATWTPASMLSHLLRLLGEEERGSTARMLDRLIERLKGSGKLLLIDEADYLLAGSGRIVETLRDLHDESKVPVMLVGMENVQSAMRRHPQLYGRVSQWVEFKPPDLEDARLVADALYAVRMEDDLLERLHAAAGKTMRGLAIAFARVEAYARRKRLDAIGSSEWGDRSFVIEPPSRRVP